ncbi:N-acetyltransferase [Bacilli bacterium]|nr:N-acetyltransferase [Bacilli bacterium]
MLIREQDFEQTESVLMQILEAYEVEQTGHEPSATEKYAWSINIQEQFAGGLTCTIWHDVMHISLLAIEKGYRHQKLATKLLMIAQEKAIEQKVTTITLNTQDFQARGFYEKLGFTVFGELKDVPYVGTSRYYLVKRL